MTFRVVATPRSFCNTPGAHFDYLREKDCEVDRRAGQHPLTADELRAFIADYDGAILGLDDFDASVVAVADKLRVISRYGVGVDQVDLKAAADRNIAVTNTPGTNSLGVAELAITTLMALARNIVNVAVASRDGNWQRQKGWEVTGKTLGVVGFGVIGREVALRAKGLQMRVVAYDPFFKGETDLAELVDLPTLLAESHAITLHLPHTPDTHNLINADTVAQMRDGAVLLNTARGGLVDEAALHTALVDGKLSGAAMDAFAEDPPTDSPLLKLDNFIATPHLGGTTVESVHRTAMLAAENAVKVLRGEPCEYIVNGVEINV